MKTANDFSAAIRHPDKLYIGGSWVNATGAPIGLVSPSTEESFYKVAGASPADVDCAIGAARRAFDDGAWSRKAPEERAGYLRRIAAILRNRAPELAGLSAGEMGSLYAANQRNIPFFTSLLDYYADQAASFPFVEQHTPSAGGAGYLVREPVGVVAAIVPWNGPLMLGALKIAPALLAGCTVILKAAPEAPGLLYALAEAAEEADLPKGVLNLITAERDVSELLVRDPRVDKVSFTGSTAAGSRIGALCGERIARCTLELGGKSPAVLMDDFDIDEFAKTIAAASTILAGQVCASLSRVIVSRSRHDALAEALGAQLELIATGDPYDPASQMGPLAMARQRDKVVGYIDIGQAEGARLVTGGARPTHLDRGYYIAPTLFANVRNDATIAREEIFGPVVSLIPSDDEAHSVRLANDTDYGLNASVFTNDPERAYTAAREIRSGTVAHNAFRNDFSIAFGGFKRSGIGREGGIEGLLPYLEAKTILLQAPVKEPVAAAPGFA
ncbi:aldehyde dehydrogenase [Sphingobium phenoxybenzoativorans]|uniref:aldehyde dehydrogenase n=1 Tax=Sphingobium phenoxybenzoativorans TaxID=1592790 RepID=UPI0008726DF7|nr:aldehyde dehydrogenase [Sphingobium phenoxybenzoativorans]